MAKVNEKVLEEFMNYEEKIYDDGSVDHFVKKLHDYDRSGIIGLIGPYGSGKSTFLEDIKRVQEELGSLWIHFDARKYPERKELRDGFVLELVEQVLPERNPEIKKLIESGKTKGQGFFERLLSFSSLIPEVGGIIQSLLTKETIPVRRIQEYEKLLEYLLFELDQDIATKKGEEMKGKEMKTIYVILEDVDRSGDEGLYFLETLNNFIRRYYKKYGSSSIYYRMTCICPIAEDSLNKNLHRYLKVLDSYDYFTAHLEYDLRLYISRAFSFPPAFLHCFSNLCMIKFRRFNCNFRMFKFILRYIYKEYKNNSYIASMDIELESFFFINMMLCFFNKAEGTDIESIIFQLKEFGTSGQEHKAWITFLAYKYPTQRTNGNAEGVHGFKVHIAEDSSEISVSSRDNSNLIKIPKQYIVSDFKERNPSRIPLVA